MNPVVHFEMPYDDPKRVARFYESAFGWQTRMLGEEMGDYVLATTTETDEHGPRKPGAINGGFCPKKPDWPAQHPSFVIAVDDVREAMKKVTAAGGQSARRADGDPRRGAVCLIHRHRGEPREHAAADSAPLAWAQAGIGNIRFPGCCSGSYSHREGPSRRKLRPSHIGS